MTLCCVYLKSTATRIPTIQGRPLRRGGKSSSRSVIWNLILSATWSTCCALEYLMVEYYDRAWCYNLSSEQDFFFFFKHISSYNHFKPAWIIKEMLILTSKQTLLLLLLSLIIIKKYISQFNNLHWNLGRVKVEMNQSCECSFSYMGSECRILGHLFGFTRLQKHNHKCNLRER